MLNAYITEILENEIEVIKEDLQKGNRLEKISSDYVAFLNEQPKEFSDYVQMRVEAVYGKSPFKNVVIHSKEYQEITQFIEKLTAYDKEAIADKIEDLLEESNLNYEFLTLYTGVGIGSPSILATKDTTNKLVRIAKKLDIVLKSNREDSVLYAENAFINAFYEDSLFNEYRVDKVNTRTKEAVAMIEKLTEKVIAKEGNSFKPEMLQYIGSLLKNEKAIERFELIMEHIG